MAEQNIDIKIKVDKQGNVELKSLEKGFDKIKITAKQASQAAKQLGVDISKIKSSGSINVAANDFNKLSKAMSGASAASGGATASVLELGRVVSDAPYGIRGVANNLQQLASNFAFMAKQAGGAGAALKAMGSALMGPLGILVAFQAVIAAIDYFSANMSKAKDIMAEMSAQTITTNVAKLHLLREALNDNNVALEDQVLALKKASTEFDELNGFIEGGSINLDAFNSQISTMIDRMKEVAFAKAVLKETEEVMQNFVKTVVKGAGPTFGEQVAGLLNPFASGEMIGAARFAKDAADFEKQYSKLYDLLLAKQKDGDGIILEHLFGKESKSGRGKRNAILKQQLFDLSKLILDSYKKQALMLEENEIEQMNIKQGYERDEVKRRKDSFLERQKQRYDDFMKKAKTDKERAQATKVWQDSQKQAEEEYQEALTAIDVKHAAERHVKMLELERKFAEELVNQRLAQAQANQSRMESLRAGTGAGRLNRPMSAVGAEDIEGQNEAFRARMEAEQQNFEDDLERKKQNLLNEGFTLLEVERMIQGERHAFQMTQAEQEIELERNKIEAKRQMNLEYASWAQGLGDIFAGIAGENKALATAALILQKGSAIANVIVDTQAANAKITANMLAEQAAFNASAAATSLVAPPLSAAFKAMSVKAGVLGKGRILKNNIGAGISIAKIAATTLQSRSAGGGGAGGGGEAGGGAPSREFDFNLVGSTGVNQLAQGVGAQFSQQPIQAYVVSSQMTSQQQLDHTIQTQASIGN
jgi:hypothetical protein